MKSTDQAKHDAVLNDALFKSYTVRCRAKTDTYKEQSRVRVTASGIIPVNYKEECKRLVSHSMRPLRVPARWRRRTRQSRRVD